jgi:hypothetical protein
MSKTGKTVTGQVVMVTGAGLESLIENCQHGPTKFCLLELQQLRASHAALLKALEDPTIALRRWEDENDDREPVTYDDAFMGGWGAALAEARKVIADTQAGKEPK